MVKSSLKAPFLKSIQVLPDRIERNSFPFNAIPFLSEDGFEVRFDSPITIFVGENGTGKSTVLEAIAALAGFHAGGGSHSHQLHRTSEQESSSLAKALRASWLPKVSKGFFFRSDTFAEVTRYIDDEGLGSGSGPFAERSHGEAFLHLFIERFNARDRCLYLLDEPEAAFSPSRQLAFMRIMREWEKSGNAQIIMVTHSPILMSYPGATLLNFDKDGITPIIYEETEHFKVTKAFLNNPEKHLSQVLSDQADE